MRDIHQSGRPNKPYQPTRALKTLHSIVNFIGLALDIAGAGGVYTTLCLLLLTRIIDKVFKRQSEESNAPSDPQPDNQKDADQ